VQVVVHNREVKWGLLAGWGIAIYAFIFLLWNILVIYGYVGGMLPRLVLTIALIAVLILAAHNLHLTHWYEMLPYAVGWILIALVLDLICTVPVSGWMVWRDWTIWVGYALMLCVPLLVCHHPAHRRHTKKHHAS
jgi:hypothetical protein